jgi:hypothetical protein
MVMRAVRRTADAPNRASDYRDAALVGFFLSSLLLPLNAR